ncbi:MAG TPA: PIN domain-containing protein [Ilumatobacteraceae bacterium]|nr:PIN domain-containing protein [Ilumatobacteraceae bacterium]
MTELLSIPAEPATARSVAAPPNLRARVVLDTSVLIADPGCLTSFSDVDVIIPLTVIEELDGLKSRPDDVGRAARAALRTLEDIRVTAGGSLAEPVVVGGNTGATVQIEINGIQPTCWSSTGSTRPSLITGSSVRRSVKPRSQPHVWCPTTRRCESRRPTLAWMRTSINGPARSAPTSARQDGE